MSASAPTEAVLPAASPSAFHSLGLDFASGAYLLPAQSPRQVARALATAGASLRHRARPIAGVDFGDLGSCGWAVVVAEGDTEAEAQLEALAPLLELRRGQAEAGGKALFEVYREDRGVRAGDSADAWLERRGVAAGLVDPQEMPAYLLLVGPPDRLSFDFQNELGVERLVGRVWFDSAEDAERWARQAVAAEATGPAAARSACVFAPANPGDAATAVTSKHLAGAVIARLEAELGAGRVRRLLGAEASCAALKEALASPPSLLFAACHGCGPMIRAPEVLGALVGQDWPGPGSGPLDRAQIFSAADVPAEASLSGLVAVLFACFGAGLPELDPFSPDPARHPGGPRLSPLPQRLLAGGAQAVVGHVDRAFLASFVSPAGAVHPTAFTELVAGLVAGKRVGEALQGIVERSTGSLAAADGHRRRRALGQPVDEELEACAVLAEADARHFQILGDPAARVLR